MVNAPNLRNNKKDFSMAVILIVDPSKIHRNSIQKMLVKEGLEVLTAESGLECMELIDERKFDCILLDSFISNQRGLDILESIKFVNKDIPVIVLTAGEPTGFDWRYPKIGAQGMVPKPIVADELKTEIKRALLNQKNPPSYSNAQSQPVCDI